ncbi:MAG TPA: class I SAM-dependent methyltransferase [Wenzhouxiangellaceae bacterium]|nr:class I SAM-dependent methyltransferase [Wenzhouxiangellaceae bacterium]
MREKYRRQWERLGAHDPFWAVLADPAKKGGRWNKREFFQTGKNEIRQLIESLARMEMTPTFGTALDFGCGTGRLSAALAGSFDRVVAVDISRAMLARARAETAELGNIEFVHNAVDDLSMLEDASVDLIYSNIVLQHIPFDSQKNYVKEFARVLAPGGAAVFQAPGAHDLSSPIGWVHALAGNRIMNIARRARYGRNGVMEIHLFPKPKMLSLLDALKLRVMHLQHDRSTGKGFIGYRYVVTKA